MKMSLQRTSTVPQPQRVLVWLSSKVQSGGEKMKNMLKRNSIKRLDDSIIYKKCVSDLHFSVLFKALKVHWYNLS